MPTDETPTYDSFLTQEMIDSFPAEIVNQFESLVYAVLDDLSIDLDFVALRYFKNKVLPQRLAYRASYIVAQIVIQRMIKEGKLKIEKIEDKKYSEFPISVVKKA